MIQVQIRASNASLAAPDSPRSVPAARVRARKGDPVVAEVWMREAPRQYDFLWLTGLAAKDAIVRFGTSTFRVIQVAHWVSQSWAPGSDRGDPPHAACAFVWPVLADDDIANKPEEPPG